MLPSSGRQRPDHWDWLCSGPGGGMAVVALAAGRANAKRERRGDTSRRRSVEMGDPGQPVARCQAI